MLLKLSAKCQNPKELLLNIQGATEELHIEHLAFQSDHILLSRNKVTKLSYLMQKKKVCFKKSE